MSDNLPPASEDMNLPPVSTMSETLSCPVTSHSKRLLTFENFPESQFTERMNTLGFKRSKTQVYTPADGDCALHAVLDGYNNLTEDSMFDRTDTMHARKMIIHHLKVELSKQTRVGCEDLSVAMSALKIPWFEIITDRDRYPQSLHLPVPSMSRILSTVN